MAKSSNQKLKLLYLKDILENESDEKHTLSVNYLKQRLLNYGISAERKAVYSDIEELRLYGLDIICERTRSNEYYIGERHFELAELKMMVDAVQASKFLTEKKSEQLIKKLYSLCSKHEATQLNRNVINYRRIKNQNEAIYYAVDEIHNAINNDNTISFKYYQYVGNKQREFKKGGEKYYVSPVTLVWDDENYYLIGYDNEAGYIKHFRVDKITDIAAENIPRIGEEAISKIDLAEYSKKVFSMFAGEEKDVRLEFDGGFCGVIIDRFGSDVMIVPEGDKFCINVKVEISPQFFGWLTSLSGNVRISAPQDVKDMYKEHLNAVMQGL